MEENIIEPEAIIEKPVAQPVEPVKEEKPKKSEYVSVFALKGITKAGLPDIVPGVNKLSKSDAEAWMALKSYITLYEGDK